MFNALYNLFLSLYFLILALILQGGFWYCNQSCDTEVDMQF